MTRSPTFFNAPCSALRLLTLGLLVGGAISTTADAQESPRAELGPIEIEVRAGEESSVRVLLADSPDGAGSTRPEISWSEWRITLDGPLLEEEGLEMGLARTRPTSWPSDLLREVVLPAGETPRVVYLLVQAAPCCALGPHTGELRIEAPEDPGGEPISIPLAVLATQTFETLATYWGPRLGAGLLLFLVLTAGWWIGERSCFLPLGELATALQPLEHVDGKGWQPRQVSRTIRRRLRMFLGWSERLRAWIRSNPLKLLVPGRRYQEVARITLTPNVGALDARLILKSDVTAHPEAILAGSLLVQATDRGFRFLARPDTAGKINNLRPSRGLGTTDQRQIVPIAANLDLHSDQAPEDFDLEPAPPRFGWRLAVRQPKGMGG